MSSFTIDQVIQRYMELRVEEATTLARHKAEIAPITEKMSAIENWLLAMMNQQGVDSYKTSFGTAYQSRLKSIKLEDPIAFKNYVLRPAAEQLLSLVQNGQQLQGFSDPVKAMLELLDQFSLWDLADMRPGKKGVQKYQEETGIAVPGVSFSEIINVNIRS
jgi:hypothetical protein